MSILPHDALAVDVYPDESPEVPLSATYEPEAHSDACTCGQCEHTFYDRLAAESSTEYARLAAEYPLDPEDGPEDRGPAEAWPPSVEWDGWYVTPVEPGPDWLPVTVPILPAACVCGVCVAAQPAHEALADAVAAEALRYKRQDTVLGSFLHAELLALAFEIRSLKAESPVEFEGRREVMERGRIDDIKERAFQEGWISGREQCPRCGRLD
jgi:hypothetical protein